MMDESAKTVQIVREWICPTCQHHNRIEVVECERCHTSRVPGKTTGTVQPGALALYIAGQQKPILVNRSTKIILGRHTADGPEVTVDLTDYHGYALGVSRRHAMLSVTDSGIFVQDLFSANGTWLNENHLSAGKPHPLKNGDLIRLGNLIVMVYLSA